MLGGSFGLLAALGCFYFYYLFWAAGWFSMLESSSGDTGLFGES